MEGMDPKDSDLFSEQLKKETGVEYLDWKGKADKLRFTIILGRQYSSSGKRTNIS